MKRFAVALLVLALVSCDESMDSQNRLKTYGAADGIDAWPAAGEALPRVAGTVAQGDLDREAAIAEPPAVSLALVQRGRERYGIYCAACHGLTGDGDGMVVQRGFPAPPSYHTDRLRQAPVQHFYDVMTNGYGAMYSFANRVQPADRWAIAAYIRALQRSQNATVAQVPDADRGALQ
jgi:mono/diheme cytochrome c family protein